MSAKAFERSQPISQVRISVQAKNVRMVPHQCGTGKNAPSHRVLVGRAEKAGN